MLELSKLIFRIAATTSTVYVISAAAQVPEYEPMTRATFERACRAKEDEVRSRAPAARSSPATSKIHIARKPYPGLDLNTLQFGDQYYECGHKSLWCIDDISPDEQLETKNNEKLSHTAVISNLITAGRYDEDGDMGDYPWDFEKFAVKDGPAVYSLSTFSGTLMCQISYIFTLDRNGMPAKVVGDSWSLPLGGGGCQGDHRELSKYENSIALVSKEVNSFGFQITLLPVGGNFGERCTIEQKRGPALGSTDCTASICQAVLRDIPQLVDTYGLGAGLYQTGVFSTPPGGRQISVEELKSMTINMDVLSLSPGVLYLYDIDNDGAEELLFLDKWGRGSYLTFYVFKRHDGAWRKVDLMQAYGFPYNEDEFQKSFSGDETLLFARDDRVNYVIVFRYDDSQRSSDGYKLDIFLIESGSTQLVGTVRARREPTVAMTIEPQ